MATEKNNPFQAMANRLKKTGPLTGLQAHELAKKKASSPVKHAGTFQGKSNQLGQGGRAAQLKARGVPGGVIGNLARAAQAAPGQKNYHKAKASTKDFAMAMKKKGTVVIKTPGSKPAAGLKEEKRKGTAIIKTSNVKAPAGTKEEKASCKTCKASETKHSSAAIKGLKNFVKEEATESKKKSR